MGKIPGCSLNTLNFVHLSKGGGAFYLDDHCQAWCKLISTNGKEFPLQGAHKGLFLNHSPQRIRDLLFSPFSPTMKFKA